MNNFIYQLKQAWSGLSVKRGFLAAVVTTLGITLGALLCVLTLAYVLIVKPLPYPDQQDLYLANSILINDKGESLGKKYSYPGLIHFFENQTMFSESALVHFGDGGDLGVLNLLPNQPLVNTTFVTPGWFTLLDTKILHGRIFEQTESIDSYNPVAILSYETWVDTFDSDSNILDKSVTVDDVNFRIVGVLAKSFIEPQLDGVGVKTDIFLPWDYNNSGSRETFARFSDKRRFVGKLDSSLSQSQIEQTLTTLVNSRWHEGISHIAFLKEWSIQMELQPFKNAILGDSKNTVLILLAGVIGLVLVACANITNLFMSRTVEQQRQLAIQAALGARKRDLFQTLFSQSGLIVFMSMILALIIASVGFWVLKQYLALRLPRVDELAINGITLSAAALIAILLGLFFARLSANMINYRALNTALQSSGKGTGVQVSKTVRQWLIISQVTIVTLLVFINIGLLKDSLKTINEPLGFETKNIFTLTVPFSVTDGLSEEEAKALFAELKDRFNSLPQVEGVSQGTAPFGFSREVAHVIEESQENLVVATKPVDGQHFRLIEQPLIEGDYFSTAELKDENKLIIINDVYAEKVAPEGSALGKKITIGDDNYTISGVVKGVQMPTATEIPLRAYPLTTEADEKFMLKLKPHQTLSRELVVRTMKEISGQLDLLELESLENQKNQILFTQYTTAITSAALTVLTFFLASVGLYGILNYSTQMRRFELGTRMAIGAKRADIISLIIKDNAGAVGVGFAVSLIALLAFTIGFSEKIVNYINFQIVPLFLVTLLSISIMALFACYWPLRKIINFPAIRSLRGSQ